MKLKFGGFQISTNDNGERFSFEKTAVFTEHKVRVGWQYTLNIADGYLLTSSEADAKTKMQALESALDLQGTTADLIYYNSDTTESATTAKVADCVWGPKLVSFAFTDDPGAQYVTYRKFRGVFQWEKTTLSSAEQTSNTFLTSFKETTSFGGGQQNFVVQEYLNSDPVRYNTIQKTKYTATQEGELTCYGVQQAPPPSVLYPAALMNADVTYSSGDRKGNTRRYFVTRWRYTYESPTPFTQTVTLWT